MPADTYEVRLACSSAFSGKDALYEACLQQCSLRAGHTGECVIELRLEAEEALADRAQVAHTFAGVVFVMLALLAAASVMRARSKI